MLRKKPYLLLWFLAAILCMAYGISYLFQIDTNFSLTVSDVYVVVAHSQLFLLFALWLLLCGFGYFVLGRYKITPVYSLTKLHILFTLLTFFIIVIDQFTNHNSLETVLVWVAILLFPIAQIIYFINRH